MRAAALFVALSASSAGAQEVPQGLALAVMLKVLTYDTHFAERGSGEFLVLVPYAKGDEARAAETVSAASAMELRSINGRPLKFVAVAASDVGAVKAAAVLLPARLPGDAAREALQAAARAGLYSLAFDEALVKAGAMLGVASNAGKPQVLLNVTTAKALGAELAPSVLKVARTFQ